jgi:hypothetical protein
MDDLPICAWCGEPIHHSDLSTVFDGEPIHFACEAEADDDAITQRLEKK